jgi:hypothetical protein
MWKAARDWLKGGGAIPADPTLRDELASARDRAAHRRQDLRSRAKKDMKARGLPSPNRADSLVLSFAFPVVKKNPLDAYRDSSRRREYDPYASR